MPDNTVIYSILIAVALIGILFYLYRRPKPAIQNPKPETNKSVPLQLQAYERLILLVDRITIPNLISRTNHNGLLARDMQLVLTRSIREEFECNIDATWLIINRFFSFRFFTAFHVSGVI